jgi:hypothetical protein
MADSSFFDASTSPFDNDESIRQQLSKIISPADASDLVPKMTSPPPDSPPASAPGQSTPRTGSLDYAPREAVPKNLDTQMGRTSYNVQPAAQPIQPAQSLQQVQSLRQNGSPVAAAGNPSQPASTGTTASGLRTVIKDLNGTPAGSPLSMLQPAGGSMSPLQPASGSANNVLPVRPAQPGVSPIVPANTGRLGAQPVNPAGQVQPASPYRLNPGPSTITPQLNAQTLAYGNLLRQRAQYPGPTTLNATPSSVGAPSSMPLLPATPSSVAPAGQQRLTQDQARLQYLQNSGSGIDQIKNPVGRTFARIGDIAYSSVLPNEAAMTPGTTPHHNVLINRQLGVVGCDQSQLQAAAQLADTQSQMNERDAQGRRFDAQANYYNPEPMSAGQAQILGHPEWEGMKLDARDAERLVGGAARNQTTLQTHFGGQQRNLSAEDAAAIRTPSLEGASMSNDEYQRLLQGTQHNQQWDTNNQRQTNQSDVNNRRTNSTRVTTTGMRDDTSEDNSDRAHPGGAGAAKPIPPAVRDRIESQKATAINKARGQFDNGESSMDDYLDNWQQAQNEYEERIGAQTGQPVQHLDIRSNVDAKGNWTGNRGTAQPQSTRQPGFVTQKGNKVTLGDPVNVNGRRGVVAGFNARTGKAQVKWDSRN